MANYKVFVNGVFVGIDILTLEDIKRINNDPTISLSKLDYASINRPLSIVRLAHFWARVGVP